MERLTGAKAGSCPGSCDHLAITYKEATKELGEISMR